MISMIGGAGSGYASMFIALKAAMPAPMNTANAISTSERRAMQNPIRPRSMRTERLSLYFVVDEDGAAPDHALARIETGHDLDQAVGLAAEQHLAPLEHPRAARDPDA